MRWSLLVFRGVRRKMFKVHAFRRAWMHSFRSLWHAKHSLKLPLHGYPHKAYSVRNYSFFLSFLCTGHFCWHTFFKPKKNNNQLRSFFFLCLQFFNLPRSNQEKKKTVDFFSRVFSFFFFFFSPLFLVIHFALHFDISTDNSTFFFLFFFLFVLLMVFFISSLMLRCLNLHKSSSSLVFLFKFYVSEPRGEMQWFFIDCSTCFMCLSRVLVYLSKTFLAHHKRYVLNTFESLLGLTSPLFCFFF